MEEQIKKAFDFASDVAKQLITLSTGIIAIVITFTKDVVKQDASGSTVVVMGLACGVYLFSILAGLWHLYALTGELESVAPDHVPTTRGKNAIIPSIVQIVSFLLGTLLMIIYGFASL